MPFESVKSSALVAKKTSRKSPKDRTPVLTRQINGIKSFLICRFVLFTTLKKMKKKKMSRNTIWMKKAAFVAYIIPSESEWKDVKSGETGLPSRVREPILIRIRLDFGHPFFLRRTTQVIEPTKQPCTFFFLANFISTESYIDPCIYMLIFFPFPGTGNREKTGDKQVKHCSNISHRNEQKII